MNYNDDPFPKKKVYNDGSINPFPIQMGEGQYRDKAGSLIRDKPCTIPWWLAEVAYYVYQKLYKNNQSLERLAERGGFGREELIWLLSQVNMEELNKVEVD